MTTDVTPIIKPEDRLIHIHLTPAEAGVFALALGSCLSTLILPEDWKALLTAMSDDVRAASDLIMKG